MQQKPSTTPTSLREIDISHYITHYVNLIWRWKLYILISAPIVMLGWSVYALKFRSIRPVLESVVVLGMDNNAEVGAVRDVGQTIQSKVDIIKGRGFLKDIVERLSLNLLINDHSRHEIFDTVVVDSTAAVGTYTFSLDQQQEKYEVFFTNKTVGIKNKIIDNGALVKLDTLRLSGMRLVFSRTFLRNPTFLTFTVIPQRIAIERLRGSIILQVGNVTRGPNNAAIIIKGIDYRLITTTVNMIADEFIFRNLNFRKRKTRDVIEMLKAQLEAATKQVAESQNAVQAFRQQYPNVGLANDIMSSVNTVTQMESSVYLDQDSTREAEQLRDKLQNATVEQNFELSEALAFLQNHRVVAASLLQGELGQLLQRQQELSVGFDKNHPFIMENRNKIATVREKTVSLLSEYIKSTNSNIFRQKDQVQGVITRIQGLPSLQLKLAELERQSAVNTQIHSQVLNRYNQAKIADVTEVTDVYVLDYAVAPVPPSDFVNVLILLGIGVLIALATALAPPVIVDFFDKTVRTESELKNILTFTVLESIPTIKLNSRKSDKGKKVAPHTRTIDKKLITSDFTHDFTNELFRSLRAKIMLKLFDQPRKRILVTSHGMGEGKSLVSSNLAITMAQQKLSTVLIDGDIRRGVQHNSFLLSKKPGLSSFLFSEDPVTVDSVTSLLQKTHVQNLSLIASGPNVPNPSELLGHPRFEQLINALSAMFDVIIFDTPPIGLAADAALVSDLFSASVIIIRAGVTDVIDLRKRLDEFPNLKKSVIGLVLNEALLDRRLRNYKYSSYYYNTETIPENTTNPVQS